jgi:hypothetical protein
MRCGRECRSHIINGPRREGLFPSGAKALVFGPHCGTAKAVPYPKPIYGIALSLAQTLQPAREGSQISPSRRHDNVLEPDPETLG